MLGSERFDDKTLEVKHRDDVRVIVKKSYRFNWDSALAKLFRRLFKQLK